MTAKVSTIKQTILLAALTYIAQEYGNILTKTASHFRENVIINKHLTKLTETLKPLVN